MGKTPIFLIAAFGTAAAIYSGQAAAATPQTSEPVSIAATGDGAWYIRCDIDNGSSLIELSAARRNYTDGRLRSATCRYQANRTPLTITVSGAGWACPFHGVEGPCQLVVRRFGEGEFHLARTAH